MRVCGECVHVCVGMQACMSLCAHVFAFVNVCMCICVCVCACTRLPNITLSARIDKCTKKSCLCMFVCASVVGACRRVSVHMGYACCVFVCMCQNAMCKPVCLMKGVSLGCSMGVTGPILMCMLFFKPVVWMCWNSVT